MRAPTYLPLEIPNPQRDMGSKSGPMSTSEAAILGIVALFAGVVAAIIALVALSSKGR